jgi:hypothetical protein
VFTLLLPAALILGCNIKVGHVWITVTIAHFRIGWLVKFVS